MIETLPQSAGSMLGVRVSGVVDKADYAVLVPAAEALVAEHGTIELLLDLTDFDREKASAWGADLAFGREFRHTITRMAIVGDGVLEKFVAAAAAPFYAREAKRFDDVDAAWAWLGSAT